MKKTKTLFLLITIFVSISVNAQWVQTGSGITNGTVVSLAANGSSLFAGTYANGIFISTNDGTNWTQSGLISQGVNAIAVLGTNIIAGTNAGLYISINNGANWSLTNLNQTVNSLAVSGANIIAGTSGYGVYISSNNGASWITGLPGQSVWSLTVLGNNIFAGTYNNGVYISTNSGTNWTQTALTNQTVQALATVGTDIFAGTYIYGVYHSTNNGANWTITGMSNLSIGSLAVSGSNIVAGTYANGIYLSTNNGVSWIVKNQGFVTIPTGNALLVTSNNIFAGTNGYSVWRRSLAEIVMVKNISTEIANVYSLGQNYPNPFNPTTKIRFDIVRMGDVKMVVYDAIGREVQTLVNESLKPGTYEVTFDGSMLNSGVYFYKLSAGSFTETKKMLIIK